MSAALLYIAERALATGTDPRPPNWYVDPPRVLPQSLAALIVARRNLVDLATVCSTILIVHVTASWMTERRHRRRAGAKVPEGEVSSVPRKEGWRTYLYGLFAVSVSMWVLCVRIALAEMRLGIWQNVNYYEIVALSMFFQFSLYISIRMAHHGFTLGELAIVCFGGTVLFMEGVNLTIARIWPITTPFVKTYRFPTPLLIYQLALIPGSLLIGFLLSPLLYLSRRLAQQPVRRLRFPAAKARDRRLLALGDTTESYLPNFAGIPNLPNLSNLPNIPNGAQMANEWLEGVPTLGMNARRKFFHALAVVMFVPGVAVDPAFLHLAFSGAFALFVFAEYVRYFALYPLGAAVHVFMNAFLDQKDAGTAILSHFYLLIGCAGCVWFEGPSRLLLYTGTLVLGVGDAMASIVGKRFGRHRWVATSGKTVEGSVALVASVVLSAWLLRVCGCAERFSVWRYTVVLMLGALLEGFSVQNDNVVLPLYVWTLLVFAEV
ncbi:uncharacterized protein LAESUDRAFT_650931 [Laetiporus sulphureus 93-53]|uniref:dolichol kinase n=1 Tax=Laetiporus sulphureus 93-53 TaxID=1314785 RepID=A0A165ET95_9APHY|nr:uncharacterized protein LAESUDRAFT_650931 [Laetiporus sulphureus 93-53]KZT07711.1 hypothetical protein LAESUDRAFT_650931 [Laetiporus sulphureus 93-53]